MRTSRKDSKRHPDGSKPATSPLSSTEQHTSISGKHRSHVSDIYQKPDDRFPPVTSSSRQRQSTDESHQSHSPPPSQSPPGTSDRKSKLRLRNREAAQKCRKRKQRSITQLQNQEVAVEAMHDALINEAAQLQQEVLVLKNMVLDHGRCNCDFIEDYIKGAASSLVHQGGAGCPDANVAPFDDGAAQTSGVVKVEDDTPEAAFLGVDTYSQGKDTVYQPSMGQYGGIGNTGASDMEDMAMSPLALRGDSMHNLGLRL